MPSSRKRVAIVGTGSAGIAALWALNRTAHDVYVYEAADRLGGHTNTVEWVHGKDSTQVDTGFMTMNTATYPNFLRFLEKLNIATAPTQLTFSVSRDRGAFEWASASLGALFCQHRNLVSLRMWRMLFDILRFNQFALDLLDDSNSADANGASSSSPSPSSSDETIGQYLERQGYSTAFRDDYLIPLTAAIWSMKPDQCALEFPVVTLVRFLWNHHLLSTLARRPEWLTIPSGAKSYVDVVTKGFPPNHLFLNTAVLSATNDPDGRVRLQLEGGRSAVYDHVILAVHGDDAYAITQTSATTNESNILSRFQTSENVAVLHSDTSLLPVSHKAWSSWNYLSLSSGRPDRTTMDQVSLTYNMNILQHIPAATFGDVLVTLNPPTEPDASTVHGRYRYKHPVYTAATVKAQQRLAEIQNTRNISYAGAWTKYGLHEDAFSSGLSVAVDHLGAKLPFEFVDSTYSRGSVPKIGIIDWILRLLLLVIQIFFVGPLDKVSGCFQKQPGPAKTKTLAQGNGATTSNGAVVKTNNSLAKEKETKSA